MEKGALFNNFTTHDAYNLSVGPAFGIFRYISIVRKHLYFTFCDTV